MIVKIAIAVNGVMPGSSSVSRTLLFYHDGGGSGVQVFRRSGVQAFRCSGPAKSKTDVHLSTLNT